jgi:hypothetical protein
MAPSRRKSLRRLDPALQVGLALVRSSSDERTMCEAFALRVSKEKTHIPSLGSRMASNLPRQETAAVARARALPMTKQVDPIITSILCVTDPRWFVRQIGYRGLQPAIGRRGSVRFFLPLPTLHKRRSRSICQVKRPDRGPRFPTEELPRWEPSGDSRAASPRQRIV